MERTESAFHLASVGRRGIVIETPGHTMQKWIGLSMQGKVLSE